MLCKEKKLYPSTVYIDIDIIFQNMKIIVTYSVGIKQRNSFF